MKSVEVTASAGVELERVCFVEQSSHLVETDAPLPDGAPAVQFAWDWRIIGERRFEVVLRVLVDATVLRPEQTSVLVAGQFAAGSAEPTVPVSEFVRAQAPAILLPWARECIASLTGRGFFGQFRLPPINVQALMKGVDLGAATGAKQLASEQGHGWAK